MPYSPDDPVVSPEWLLAHLNDPALLIIDCRFDLFRPEWGREAYRQGHIPGAHFVDLETELAAPRQRPGGRHPLPDPGRFGETMRRLGLSEDRRVVAYDQEGQGAARLWWLLQYFGHPAAWVLDGGWPAWLAMGGPVTQDVPPTPLPGRFQPTPDPSLVADHAEVLARAQWCCLIDARSPERYRGEEDPLDQPAGHIPGAVNLTWSRFLDQGRYKPPEVLRQEFGSLFSPDREVVVYCGSGVSACVDVIGLRRMGLSPRLYPGSWSDWISRPGLPIAKGAE
ncbi:MAG: sulfurtransferase [Firmicutes bacterium]|nr:sulfurtransferase [Alicyclobacillaceae bacterium]MCL6498234.1 sulfurtransferase [Bacillota bacterium]